MTVDDCATYSAPPLPDHIISLILTRLPAKSATRFKAVSKQWHSLISSHHFISHFLSHSPPSWSILDRVIRVDPDQTHPLNLTLSLPPSVSFFSMHPLLPIPAQSKGRIFPALINGNNGLILFSITTASDAVRDRQRDPDCFCFACDDGSLFICNPMTKQFVYLPDPPDLFRTLGALAFSTYVLVGPSGSGFDFVIAVFQPVFDSETAMLMAFSSRTWKWKVKSAKYELVEHNWFPNGGFELNGVVYFYDLSYGLIAWDHPCTAEKIVTLRYLSLPSECRSVEVYNKSRCIGASGGHIQCLDVIYPILNLWRFKDCEGGEWTVVCKVNLRDFRRDGFPCIVPECQFFHPLDPFVVVFKVFEHLFILDLRDKKVVGSSMYSNLIGKPTLMPFVVPSWPTPIPLSMISVSEKDRGNEFFMENSFNEAVRCYSRSIISSPTATGYANRAAAYLNINQYQEAERDCTQALKLDDNYMEAYAHRAVARKELGKLEEAKEDIEHALKSEPEHADLLKQYAEINFLLEKAAIKEDCSNISAVFQP